MTKWIIVSSLIVAAIVLGYFHKDLGLVLEDPVIPALPQEKQTTIYHSFKDGVHRYSGWIELPHSCYSTAVDARRDARYPSSVLLFIMTRDGMTDANICLKIPTRYPFETVFEAPESAALLFFVDEEKRPTRLIETPWQNPRGTILNLENL